MAFLETPRFPDHISAGSTGSPMYSTSIVTLSGGQEKRNRNWSYPRFKYDVSCGVKDITDLYEVYEFFLAVGGPADGFRFKDYMDHSSADWGDIITNLDQSIGVGDGAETEFQLYKFYVKGALQLVRPILKPVAGSVVISLNGASQTSGWTVNTATGVVTFTAAPGNGVVVRAGFEFDVPVRFESDEIQVAFPEPSLASSTINLVSLPYE